MSEAPCPPSSSLEPVGSKFVVLLEPVIMGSGAARSKANETAGKINSSFGLGAEAFRTGRAMERDGSDLILLQGTVSFATSAPLVSDFTSCASAPSSCASRVCVCLCVCVCVCVCVCICWHDHLQHVQPEQRRLRG